MRTKLGKFAAVAALVASVQAQAAAPHACITRAEARGLMAYLAPVAIGKLGQTCRTHGAETGFFRSGLADLEARYAAGRDGAWPMARSAITKFAGSDMKGLDISSLSDAAVRPLADEIIAAKLNLQLTRSDCLAAEEIVSALAPIDPDAALNLLTAIVGVVIGKGKSMPICPRES